MSLPLAATFMAISCESKAGILHDLPDLRPRLQRARPPMGCCASAGCLPVREEDGGKLGELGVEDLLVRGVALLHHLPQLLGTSAEPGELLDQPVHVEGVNGLREPGKPELRHQDVMLRGVTDRYG